MKYLKINGSLSLMFFACVMLSVFSCTNDDKFDLSDEEEVDFTIFGVDYNIGGTAVAADSLNNDGMWDLCCVDDQVIEYKLYTSGETASSIERSITHSSGATGMLSAVTEFPSRLEVTMLEALAATGLTADEVMPMETFTIGHWLNGVRQGADVTITLFSSVLVWDSALHGTANSKIVVTNQMAGIAAWEASEGNTWEGPVRFERQQQNVEDDGEYIVYSQSAGQSEFEDISFGGYYGGYGTDAQGSLPNGDLRLRDIDNKLSITGASQWGEVYTITDVVVSADQTMLSFAWTNDYGEGALVELTRTDGELWSPDLN